MFHVERFPAPMVAEHEQEREMQEQSDREQEIFEEKDRWVPGAQYARYRPAPPWTTIDIWGQHLPLDTRRAIMLRLLRHADDVPELSHLEGRGPLPPGRSHLTRCAYAALVLTSHPQVTGSDKYHYV